jgi:hypothetical protein
LSLDFARDRDRVTLRVRAENAAGHELVFMPAFGLGTKILGATRNGAPVAVVVDERSGAQAVRPSLTFPLSGDDTVELRIEPAPEIVLPDAATMTGDLSRGARLIGTELDGRDLRISLEGLAGESYVIDVVNGDRVDSVEGAAFDGRRLSLVFPAAAGAGGYVPAEVILRIKT